MLYFTYHRPSSKSDEPRIDESLVESFGVRYTATEPAPFLRLYIAWWKIVTEFPDKAGISTAESRGSALVRTTAL